MKVMLTRMKYRLAWVLAFLKRLLTNLMDKLILYLNIKKGRHSFLHLRWRSVKTLYYHKITSKKAKSKIINLKTIQCKYTNLQSKA